MDHNDTETPLDPVEVLRARAQVAAGESQQEIKALRAMMSDDEVLDQFGVDLSQFNP